MEEKLTVEQVLRITIDALNKIRLPIEYLKEINTISGCIGNMEECIAAIEKAKEENAVEVEAESGGEEDGTNADIQ